MRDYSQYELEELRIGIILWTIVIFLFGIGIGLLL
jgi:hypothetical protein